MKKGEGGPQREEDQKLGQIKRKSVCDSFTAWLRGKSHWPCFDSETLNDMWEVPSYPLLKKTHDQVAIFNSWRVFPVYRELGIKQESGWKEQMDRGADIRSVDPGAQTKKCSAFKIPLSVIFYSEVDGNYCLFPPAEWMCNLLRLPESWQFDNWRAATAVWQPESCHWGGVLFFCQSSLSQHTSVRARTHTFTNTL